MKTITQLFHCILFISLAPYFAAADSFQSGVDAYDSNEYGTAFAAFEGESKANESAAVRHNLALAAFQDGKVSEAVWQLERAIQLAPLNREYRFKLGALRQEIGLFDQSPKWFQIAASALSLNQWILIGSLAFWTFVALIFLPWMRHSRIGIFGKLTRFVAFALIVVSLPMIWLSLKELDRAILISDSTVDLHAAPAAAAPVAGTGRAGERARLLQSHQNFFEIVTEGGVKGWVSKESIRPLVAAKTDS